MNQRIKREEAERLVDNCLQRILFLAKSTGAHARVLEAIETERGVSRAVIRSVRCGCPDLVPREGGTVEVDGGR